MAAELAPAPQTTQDFRFRSDLVVTRQVQGGEVAYIVKDPKTRKYFRFREVEHAIFSRLDGKLPLAGILVAIKDKFPAMGLRPEDLANFIVMLKRSDLLEKSSEEKNLMALEKLREQRKQKIKTANANPLARALYLHYHLFDPDRLFDKMLPHLLWMWSRPFVVFSLVLFATAALINLRGIVEISGALMSLYSFEGTQWYDYLQLWGLSLACIVLHEFGHGLTCKRFGGEVHDLGFLLIFFNPAMYCNVSDAYTFDNRRHKLYVTAAGGFVELLIWSVASIVWVSTYPGLPIHDLALKLMLVSGVATLAFNFNPLMKLDGYYALLDILGVANLRDNALDWVKMWIKRNIFGLRVPLPAIDSRLERIYAVYGFSVAIFSGMMLVVMLVVFKNLIIGKLHLVGLPIYVALVYTLYGGMVRQAYKFLKETYATKRELMNKPTIRLAAGGAILAALLALIFVKAPATVLQPFTLDPGRTAFVRATVGGRIVEVRAQEGKVVRVQDVLVVLEEPDLTKALADLRSRRGELERLQAQARYDGDQAAISVVEAQLSEADAALAKAGRDAASLVLRAPMAGMVLTPNPRALIGTTYLPGEEILEIGTTQALIARIQVPENDVGEVRKGQLVDLAFRALPGKRFGGKVGSVAPVGKAGNDPKVTKQVSSYEVTLEVLNPDGRLVPGMTGEARIVGAMRPLYGLLLHAASKTFNPDFI